MNRFFASTKWFLGITAFYIVLMFVLPANHITKANYNLSDTQYHVLLFLVQVPIIAVWIGALYGYTSLRRYTERVRDTPEGKDFATMTKGMGWIAWGLPVPSTMSILLNSIANSHPGFQGAALIITNYAYVIVSFMAFHYFSRGTGSLAERSQVRLTMSTAKRLLPIFVVIGLVFCYLMFSKFQNLDLGNSFNAFYLPNWLIALTIMLPYLYAWSIGLLAAYVLILIARQASGVLYKRAVQLLALGLAATIIGLFALQYFRAIVPRSGHLTVGGALLCIYAIYAISTTGYLLLAAGARRLKKIEEV